MKIKEWIDARDPNATVIPFSGAFELKVEEKVFVLFVFLFVVCLFCVYLWYVVTSL